MKSRGTSAGGLPVYSSTDPAHFLERWLRLSWPSVLCGRTFDSTGETTHWWLCAVRDLELLPSAPVRPRSGQVVISADLVAAVLVHVESEDSALNPRQPFTLAEQTRTFVIEAAITEDVACFEVREFRVRKTTREMEAMAARYGGDLGFHEWTARTSP